MRHKTWWAFCWLCFILAIPAAIVQGAELTAVEMIDCARAANRAFNSSKFYIPCGFSLLMKSDSSRPFGFQAAAFRHEKSGIVVMAISGSNGGDPGDILANMGVFAAEIDSLKESVANLLSKKSSDDKTLDYMKKMTLGRPAQVVLGQIREAESFLQRVRMLARVQAGFDFLHANPLERKNRIENPPTIYLSGHSLGGYLVQILSARYGIYGETFNAPGASGFLKGARANTIDHIRRHDLVGIYGRHAGQLVCYPDVPIQWSNFPKPFFVRNHLVEDFLDDLKKGIKPVS
jgi:hypothetical protein